MAREQNVKSRSATVKRERAAKKKVVFVCTGNTCRSPMAEALFKQYIAKKRKSSCYEVLSAGLSAEEGAPMTDNAVSALKALGVRLRRKHAAKQLTRGIAKQADLIVCMTRAHAAALSEFGEKVKSVGEITGGYDVPDPYGGDLALYKKTAEYLMYCCEDVYALCELSDRE